MIFDWNYLIDSEIGKEFLGVTFFLRARFEKERMEFYERFKDAEKFSLSKNFFLVLSRRFFFSKGQKSQ